MRTRTWKGPLFFVVTTSTLALLMSVACGGKEEPKTPTGDTASASPSGDKPSGDTTSSSSSGGTTTTSQLDASDLQGAKLQSSSRKEIETKGDGGPRPPSGGSDEPGRRRDDIKTIILTHRDEARACYDKALDTHPGIEGDIQIKWTIDPDGNVTNPAVDHGKSQIHEESVGTCIIDVIKKIKFAASGKGYETHAAYPFNFHPKASQLKKKDGGA